MLARLSAAFSDGEIEISGNASGLNALAAFLVSDALEFNLEEARHSNAKRLSKSVTSSALSFHPTGDSIGFEGSFENLRVLAEAVQTLALEKAGYHVHFTPGTNPIVDETGRWELVVGVD